MKNNVVKILATLGLIVAIALILRGVFGVGKIGFENLFGRKICEKIESLLDLNEKVCIEAGLGPMAKDSLLEWYFEKWTNGYDRLPFSWKTTVQKRTETETKGIVCITGKLKSYKTKAAAKQILEKKGYLVKNSLTKDVTILVNESGVDSAKTQAALDRGVQIITNLKQL